MGANTSPISPGTRQLNQAPSAEADINTGAATFTFQPPPAGQTATGTLAVEGAPSSAQFNAFIGGTFWGDWEGNSVAGPVQCIGSAQTLVVKATGLVPGQNYQCTWIGSIDDNNTVQPVWPDVNVSAVEASLANLGLGGGGYAGGNANFPESGVFTVVGPGAVAGATVAFPVGTHNPPLPNVGGWLPTAFIIWEIGFLYINTGIPTAGGGTFVFQGLADVQSQLGFTDPSSNKLTGLRVFAGHPPFATTPPEFINSMNVTIDPYITYSTLID